MNEPTNKHILINSIRIYLSGALHFSPSLCLLVCHYHGWIHLGQYAEAEDELLSYLLRSHVIILNDLNLIYSSI